MKSIRIFQVLLVLAAEKALASSPADFLLSNLGARNHSLGGAFAADREGTSCWSRKPSTLCLSTGTPLNLTLGFRPEGIKIFQIDFSRRFKNQPFGFNFLNLIYPVENALDQEGNKVGEFKNSDLAFCIGTAKKMNQMMFGVTGTFARKKVADSSAVGFSFTGSLLFPWKERLSFGVSLNDLTLLGFSFDREKEFFPTQFRAGLAARAMDRDQFRLNLLMDFMSSREQKIHLNFGSELNLNEIFFLRGGIATESEGGRLGIGIWVQKLSLDWAMQLGPVGGKDGMHLTLGYRF